MGALRPEPIPSLLTLAISVSRLCIAWQASNVVGLGIYGVCGMRGQDADGADN